VSAGVFRRAMDRLTFAIGRGKVKLVDDAGPVQLHQVDVGPIGPEGSRGVHDNTPMMHFFGFTSVPPEGSDAIVLFVGGRRSSAVAIGTNHQAYRLKDLEPGEAALYDMRGAFAKFTAGGLVIDAAGLDVVLRNARNVTGQIYGDYTLEVAGKYSVTAGGDLDLNGQTINLNEGS
jgi:phage baseplate assembly protein V